MSPLLRQGASYVVVGLLQLALDSALFVLLSASGIAAMAANPLARASAAGLGFWLNGRYTFAGNGEARLGRARLRRYTIIWLSLTALSTLAVAAAEHRLGLRGAWLAKPAIEASLALASFALLRAWVYRP